MDYKRATYLLIFLIFTKIAFAFDAASTHPKLTEESVKFYNFYSERKINDQELEWLRQGSREEDFSPRWANHFYDPIHNIALNKKYFRGYIPEAGWSFIFGFALPKDPIKSIDWALNQEYQFFYYKLNRTWQKAIVSYLRKDYETAFKSLGHILHLLQDLGVPEHARGDPHIGIGLDPKSYFEDYAKEYLDKYQPEIAKELYSKGVKFKKYTNIYEIFNELAKFTANNWFSEDTINNDFPYPRVGYKIKNPDGYLYYSYLNIPLFWEVHKDKFNLITTEHKEILYQWFNKIKEPIILHSASLIELYFRTIEEIRNNPSLLSYYIYEEEDKGWFKSLWNQPLRLLSSMKGRLITTMWENLEHISSLDTPSVSTIVNRVKNPLITPPKNIVFNIANIYQILKENKPENKAQEEDNETAYFEEFTNKVTTENKIEKTTTSINTKTANTNLQIAKYLETTTSISFITSTNNLATNTDNENNEIEEKEDEKEEIEEKPVLRGGGGVIIYRDKCEDYKNKSYPNLIISEIQIESATNTKNEFIEIYNPNNQEIDITCWVLEKYSSISSPTDTPSTQILLPKTKSSGTIKPFSFYLIANKNYAGTITPDYIYAESYSIAKNNSLILRKPNGEISDIVGFGDNKEKIYKYEKEPFILNNLQSKSIQRLNYLDTNDNSKDFKLRNPNPKNSNFTEKPREDFVNLEDINIDNFVANVTTTDENVFLEVKFKEPLINIATTNYFYKIFISTSSNFENTINLDEFGINTSSLTILFDGKDRIENLEINKCPVKSQFYIGIQIIDKIDDENISKIFKSEFNLPEYLCEQEHKLKTNAKILISEIFIREGTSTNEYIELYNPNNFEVYLDGWNLIKINKEGKEEYIFSTSTKSKYKLRGKIKAYGYFLLANSNNNLEKEFSIKPDVIYSKDKDFAKNNKLKLINTDGELIDLLEWENFDEKLILVRKAGIDSTKESIKNEEKDFGNSYDNEENKNEFIEFDSNEPQNSYSKEEIPPDYLTNLKLTASKQNIKIEFNSPYQKLNNAIYEIRKENDEKININLPEVKEFGKKEAIEFNGCYYDLKNNQKLKFNLVVNNEIKNQYELEIKGLDCALFKADGNENINWGRKINTAVQKIAQQIKIDNLSYIKNVKLKLSKIDSLEGDNIWLKIYKGGDKPEKGNLIFSTKIAESSIIKSFEPNWVDFNLENILKLEPDNYFFVFEREKMDDDKFYFSAKAKYWPDKNNKFWYYLPVEGGWAYYSHSFQDTYETLAIIIE